MTTERVFDEDLIWCIMTMPEIFATVAEDDIDKFDWHADVDNEAYLVASTPDDGVIGVHRIHAHNRAMCEIHVAILPEFRRQKKGRQASIEALSWIHEYTDYEKVFCWVPVIYPNVRRFAESFGFRLEGTNRKSYRKNGSLHDQWLLGITRDEIAEVIK